MMIYNLMSKVEEFYENTRSRKDIDVSKNLSWGYYFSSIDKGPLERVKELLLNEKGYSYAEIIKEEDSKYYLHIEKIEKHTINSLTQRDIELKNYAEEFNIESYDGFDVEKIGFI